MFINNDLMLIRKTLVFTLHTYFYYEITILRLNDKAVGFM